MNEKPNLESSDVMSSSPYMPVPAARPLSDFSWEKVGDDVVILDVDSLQYHTLNSVAMKIWRSCDGVSTVETIAASTQLPVEVVETTIAELGEASLLRSPASSWSIPMNRRRAAKLIAASAAGAVGVPVVLSLTAPSHQAAATIFFCGPGGPCTVPGETCTGAITGCQYRCQNVGGFLIMVPVTCPGAFAAQDGGEFPVEGADYQASTDGYIEVDPDQEPVEAVEPAVSGESTDADAETDTSVADPSVDTAASGDTTEVDDASSDVDESAE